MEGNALKIRPYILGAFCFLAGVTDLWAQEAAKPAVSDQPTLILIVGAEGAPEFGKDFHTWADRWAKSAEQRKAKLIQIGRDAETDGTTDRQRLETALKELPAGESSQLWIVLIGHGTFDGREAKFNLRGPDFSADELVAWLAPIKRPIALIDCSSASAPMLNKLSAAGRIVVTATRSGSEVSFARFGDYLSNAIADTAADLDKDGQTSLLEAFLSASHRTLEFYKQGNRLASEHALLDDNGDKQGIAADWFDGIRATRQARGNVPLDGPRAHQWHFILSAAEQTMSPDDRAKRDALELTIEALRQRKSTLTEDDYYAQIEPLLQDLARLYEKSPSSPAPATR